ncbi:MAG: Two-component sensor histidine kinaselike protein [Paenibacillaceae bacterium]|nr:Two-component sensor histidine kinaselike protein [Paenibacillaceae bacterium]
MKKGQPILLLLVSLIVLSIIAPLAVQYKDDNQTPAIRRAKTQGSAFELAEWEYAWSEYSPSANDNMPDEGSWEKTARLINPPGREGRQILWMRTRLPQNAGYDPTVLVQASQLFEVYLDGELLFRHGEMQGAHPRYIGTPPRMISLPDDAPGKLLSVRIYSTGKDIGLLQTPLLASESDLTLSFIKKQGVRFILGSFYIMIGLISCLAGLRIRQSYLLSFACFAGAFGLYTLSRTMLVYTLIDSPEFWMVFELAFLVLSVTAVLRFTEQLFPESGGIKFRLSRIHLFSGAIGLPFVSLHFMRGAVFLLLYQILLLVSIIITVVRIGRIAWKNDKDAGQVLAGLAIFCAFGAGDIIRQMLMLESPFPEFSYWGGLAFLTSLIVVILRRIHSILFQLSNTEKLSVAGQMAAGVVHEIRNPVTVISGYLQLMKKGTQINHAPMIDLMLGEVNRINLLVNEFLFLARPSGPKFALKSICGIIGDNLRLFEAQATGAGVELEFRCPPNVPLISCDENQIKQVLVNVIKNGLESMTEDGGKLTVEVESAPPYIRLQITDTGCGIESQDLKMIGEPFFTTKESGNGLGIMICRRIVDNHKGTFHIQSQPGQGTTVEIILPFDPQTT